MPPPLHRARPLRLSLVLLLGASAVEAKPAAPSLEDLLALPVEDLLKVQVSVASHFLESDLASPSTVATIGEDQWRKRGARRLHDAIGHLPSTIVLPNWFGAEQVMIRGYADGNNSGGIATLWDGVALNSLEGSPQFYRQNINLGTLERIEMIRGPGSALHGENAFHGVLSLRAFESDRDLTRVNAGYASNGYYEVGARRSQAIGAGWRMHLSLGANGQPDQSQAYDYVSGGMAGTGERELRFASHTAVLKLTSDPGRDWSYYAGLYHDQNDYNDFYSAGTSGAVASRDTGGVDSPFSMAQAGLRYRYDALTDVDLKLYYFELERRFERAFANPGAFPGVGDFVGQGDESAYGASLTLKQRELLGNTQWSLVLSTRSAAMNDYTRQVTDTTGVVVPSLTGPLAFSGYQRDIYSIALDAATVLADGQFQLRYGGRYDRYSDFGGEFSPHLGLIYQPAPDTAYKLLYGHAFRAPSAGEVQGFASIAPSPDIQPEGIDSYELVYLVQGANTKTELTLFRSSWQDAIVVGPTTQPGFFGEYVNSGNNRAQGVEAAWTYHAAPWTAELSGSYVRSENQDTGQDYNAFPKWILNAGVGYHWAAYRLDMFVNSRVHLGADDMQYASGGFTPQPLKDYWRTDLHLARPLNKQARLTLDVRNLLGRRNYVPSIQTNPSPGGLAAEERSVKLGLWYRF